jgi:acyl-CoA thioesterase FadM
MNGPDLAPAGDAPFVHRLRPTWGDSDPALMVYTARFPDFALRAIDAWMLANVGVDFYCLNVDWGIGTPFVHLTCDFRSPATPRDTLLIAVQVERVGKTSLAFRVAATIEADGRLCFEGRFVCVCVDSKSQSQKGARPMPLDPRIRAGALADLARTGCLPPGRA